MISKLTSIFKKALPKNTFLRGVIALSGGTVGAQVILIAASPLLTRLYTPEMFGVMAVFVGFSTVLSTLATWRYEIAIPQTENDQAAASLAVLCFSLSLLMFVISGAGVFLFYDAIVPLFGLEEIAGLVWLIPLFILSLGIYQVLTFCNYRQKRFGIVAASTVSKNISTTSAQLVFYTFGPLALLGGQLLGQLISVAVLWRSAFVLIRQKVTLNTIKYNAWRFRKYPMFSSWSGFTGGMAQQAPILMFAALFSPIEAGLYSLAYRMVSLPGSLVGGAVANVFLPHAAEAYRDGALDALLINVHLILARLAMPASVFVAIVAPDLFAFVFGSEWRDAGHYAQWLTMMLYAQFIYSPVSTSFGIINRQDVGLLLHIGLLLVSVSSIWVGSSIYQSTLVTVALYSIANAVLYLWALIWIHGKAGGGISALFAPIWNSVWRSIPIAIPLLMVSFLSLPLWSDLVLYGVAVFFTALYYRPLLQQLRSSQA